MIHPDTELRLITREIGYGPVATRFIPKGTIAWVQDKLDIVLRPEEVEALPPAYLAILDRYSFTDPSGYAVLCWDHGRFMNHHCEPAVRGVTPQFQITVRDVHPGEELTCEYAECNVVNLECFCGSPKCRGTINAEDLLDHGAPWELEVKHALEHSSSVPQPLWKYVLDPQVVQGVIDGRTPPTPMPGFYHAKDAKAARSVGAHAMASRAG